MRCSAGGKAELSSDSPADEALWPQVLSPRGHITDPQSQALSFHSSDSQVSEHFLEPGQQTRLRGHQTPWCI